MLSPFLSPAPGHRLLQTASQCAPQFAILVSFLFNLHLKNLSQPFPCGPHTQFQCFPLLPVTLPTFGSI